ncbi:MAG TPA: hypothetical protein VFQ38_10290 [Longimicrobiales bacterium]|nr:hypothetical protein [Longimicrobiales bacterium]
MSASIRLPTILAMLPLATPAGCGGDGSTGPPYEPTIPAEWAASVTNPFFPLTPGTVWEYSAKTGDGTETTRVEVLAAPRVVNGVTATVVRDQVSLNGSPVEDTYDWYAQDAAGNVWYLGEDSRELKNGIVVGTEGSWMWGARGALPGIIMWADPAAHRDEEYRQEYERRRAEDWGKVVALDQTVRVPFGTFTGCIRTEDWSGLEGRSSSLEYKYYCPNIGTVMETPADAPDERAELTAMTST